jgi:lipoate-protein ligase B
MKMELPQISRQHAAPMWLLEMGIELYESAWALQHSLVQARLQDTVPDVLMMLEHTPVITLGRRAESGNVLASPDVLKDAGISVFRVERGGDVTYHGPGQLVGYPILKLCEYGIGVSDYMHLLEEVIIRALRDLGLRAQRREGIIGVWIGPDKIASLGTRVERGVTYHGFALNINPAMEHFDFIIPCGITDGGVTSATRELEHPVPMSQAKKAVRRWFAELFRVRLEPVAADGLDLRLLDPAPQLAIEAVASS